MRIAVECGGFSRAADACLVANQTGAVLTASLMRRLSGCGGMAGDDATSADFARAYDPGAREAVAAVADLTHAFVGAGRLLARTGDNHARAEAAASRAGHGDGGVDRRETPVLGFDGGTLPDDAFVRVVPDSPPSSVGGQEPSLGVVDRWILDQVEGFVWPSADVVLLRTAGSAWRRAASSTAGLADHVDAAVALVEQQRSPEVPLAVDALTDLGVLVGDTAWQLSHLADACESYAEAVEAAHERTRALVTEVARMVVEGAAISALVTGLSGGLGGGAAAAAAVARVKAVAPRFVAVLTALRAGVAVAAARMERVCEELVRIRAQVARFVRVPARDEIGSMKHPPGWSFRREAGWLRHHEVPPGHTLERHVGKTVDELLARLRDHPRLKRASTFDDETAAERLIDAVIRRRSDDINAWADGPAARLTLIEDLHEPTGLSVARDGTTHRPTGLRVVLRRDEQAPSGWRILTAFPDQER